MNDKASDSNNGGDSSLNSKFQNAVGTLVVAGIVALVASQYRDGRAISSLTRDMIAANERLGKIDEFHKWPRFTRDHFDTGIAAVRLGIIHLESDLSKLEERTTRINEDLGALSARHYELKAAFSGLPPVKWQARITETERTIASLKEKVRSLEKNATVTDN